mmetsp:Transcript_28886/g.21506  ORF Transcript_28886/g.21506 Transcript_28886/m.21506 type:complete len:85 (-) Transcript_28886:499-753(-)
MKPKKELQFALYSQVCKFNAARGSGQGSSTCSTPKPPASSRILVSHLSFSTNIGPLSLHFEVFSECMLKDYGSRDLDLFPREDS